MSTSDVLNGSPFLYVGPSFCLVSYSCVWRTSSNISCSTGLLLMNSLPQNCFFFSLLFLKYFFFLLNIEIWVDRLYFFQDLKKFHSTSEARLLKRIWVKFVSSLLCLSFNQFFFPLFKIFIYSCILGKLIITCLGDFSLYLSYLRISGFL